MAPGNSVELSYLKNNSGFLLKVGKFEYEVKYPTDLGEAFGGTMGDKIIENYLFTLAYPLIFTPNLFLDFKIGEPLLKELVEFGAVNDLPRVSYKIDRPISDVRNMYKEGLKKISFDNSLNQNIQSEYSQVKTDKNSVFIAMSFGKDSLLSYALAKEMGMKINLAYVADLALADYGNNEFNTKQKILKMFEKDTGEKVLQVNDSTDKLYYGNFFPKEYQNVDKGTDFAAGMNSSLIYCLNVLPLAVAYGCKHVLFGNEQNFNNFFILQGQKAYPSFDQTGKFMSKENNYLSKLTKGSAGLLSLIEPIYKLGEFRLIYHRYPHLLKYIMSCDTDLLQPGEKWCCKCTACYETFLFSWALGGNPKQIGIELDLFDKKYQTEYILFNQRERALFDIYDRPYKMREEQLLAFLMAYQNGAEGDLIEYFKENYLVEALEREKELRKLFFGIHKSVSVPDYLKNKLFNIFREELDPLLL